MKTYEVIFVNKYVRELFGDIEGKICWQTLQAEQTGPCDFCTNNKIVDAGGNPTIPYVWEFRNTKADRWYYIVDRALSWVDGRIVRLEIATDISERKQAEQILRESEARLQEAQRIAKMGNWDWDIVHNRLWWSDETCRIFGLSPQKFGATFESFINAVHPDDRERVNASVQEALQKGSASWQTDYRIDLADKYGAVCARRSQNDFRQDGKACPADWDRSGRYREKAG